MPAVPAPDPEDRARTDARAPGPANVVYWFLAGALYIALGVAYPPAFLLGFQESLVVVFLVTFLQRPVVGWWRRRGR